MARIDTYARTLLPKEQILWIAGKNAYEMIIKSQHLWFKLHKIITEEIDIAGGTPIDYFSSPLQIADTIYFADMAESLPLQLADVCCSVITNHLLKRPEAEPFYEIIREQVVHSGAGIAFEWLK
jgi:hypothetical protein